MEVFMTETQVAGRDERGRFLAGNKEAQKHGIYSLANGRVPQIRGIRKIRKELEVIQRELEVLIPNMDAKTRLLVSQVVKTQGIILLLEKYMLRAGILAPDQWKKGIVETQPAVRIYLQILDSQRRSIAALNIDNERATKILTPLQIVQAEEEKQREK
jgi:hypothetical protein